MGSETAKLLREIRYALRVETDGYLYSPLVDPEGHGTPMSYMSYGCRCTTCRAWQGRRCQVQKDERNQARTSDVPVVVQKVATDASDLLRTPPVIPAVRSRIETIETLRAISNAYYKPDWRAPATGHPGRERRAYGTMQIIVGRDGNVIAFNTREVGTGKSEVLAPTRRAAPKVHGTGGGSRGPTSQRALIELLTKNGCSVSPTGSGHVKASKDGKSVILPSTTSDWRSLRNALSDAKKQGLL